MFSCSVGYTARDLVYQWTAGRGVNIARYQHGVMVMTPSMMTQYDDTLQRYEAVTVRPDLHSHGE